MKASTAQAMDRTWSTSEDKHRMLVGLAAGLGRCIAVLGREDDLGTAVLCLRMAQMELCRMIHGMADGDYDAFSDTTEGFPSNAWGDLAP